MLRDPLGEKIASPNGVALGSWTSDPDMIELMAYLGFDWVMIDQMFTSNDWTKTELLIRTAEAAGITPAIRLPAFPWLGYDPTMARNLSRIGGIGANYVRMSASSLQELKECALVARDYHKKLMNIFPLPSDENMGTGLKKSPISLWPLAETMEMMDAYKEIIALPEVKIFGFSAGDGTRLLAKSDKANFWHPAFWERIDEAVVFAKQHDTVIGCNTGYGPTLPEIHKRVVNLVQHGVRVVMVQGTSFLFQVAIGQFLRDLKSELPSAS